MGLGAFSLLAPFPLRDTMIKKQFLLLVALVGFLVGCNTEKRNPLGPGLVGRDPGDVVAVSDIPLRSAQSFHVLIFPTRMGEQEELLVGQMNGFLLRGLLRFTVPIGQLAGDAGGVSSDLVVDSLRVNLGIRSARLIENASLVALQPDSPWEELQTFVDTVSLAESEVLATPIPGAITQVLEDRIQIDLPVSLLEAARHSEADAPSVEILLQPEGEASFLLDIFAREASAAGSSVPIPELELVYRVGDLPERTTVQADADTYWSARVNGGPPKDLLILSEGLFYGSILNFDLPTDIPPGATINSAKLQFDIDLDRSYFASFFFEIYHLEFSEGARDTTFTRYNTPLSAEPTTATYTFNQSLIQAWTSGAQVNHGLALSPINFTSASGLPALLHSPPLIKWLVLKDVRLDLVYSLPPEL